MVRYQAASIKRKHKKNENMIVSFTIKMAVRTGLEPATSCVTGRHSNQLNYRTI
ncbi:hypothetical protein EMIT0133MI5_80001 [Bacillus velezensis]|nr:protein of unknown function [Bacillus velezensis]